jgi:hypothetical protein
MDGIANRNGHAGPRRPRKGVNFHRLLSDLRCIGRVPKVKRIRNGDLVVIHEGDLPASWNIRQREGDVVELPCR